MATFLQGDTALWYDQHVTIDIVYTDGQTGLPFYRISDPEGRLFQPASYTFVGEYQLSPCPVSVPQGAPVSAPGFPSFQYGYDALVHVYPMGGFMKVTVSFPARTFFAYNPVSSLRFMNDQLVPFSRASMSRQGSGEEVYEMATIDLLEGDYLAVRPSGVTRVLFVLMNGQLIECVREGDVVVGVLSAA